MIQIAANDSTLIKNTRPEAPSIRATATYFFTECVRGVDRGYWLTTGIPLVEWLPDDDTSTKTSCSVSISSNPAVGREGVVVLVDNHYRDEKYEELRAHAVRVFEKHLPKSFVKLH